MSEADIVTKVGDLMRALDDVKMYRELAYAIIDFLAIIVISVIAVIAINMFQLVSDILFGYPSSIYGQATLFGGVSFPASPLVFLADLIILSAGVIFGVYRVNRRVHRTRVGEWKGVLEEGAPGAIRLLSDVDWDSLLGTVSLARVSYLFYALIKVVGYFILVTVLLSFVLFVPGLLAPLFINGYYGLLISLALVLLLTRKSLAEGFHRLQSLDSLYWDLRWFASEFKRAGFNQA